MVAILFVLASQAAWGLFFPNEYVVKIELNGLACGAHFDLSPRHLDVKPGSWIRIVNTTSWTHTVLISDEEAWSGEGLMVSPEIKPGESWRFRLMGTGTYYMMSQNRWHFLSGLAGQIWVAR